MPLAFCGTQRFGQVALDTLLEVRRDDGPTHEQVSQRILVNPRLQPMCFQTRRDLASPDIDGLPAATKPAHIDPFEIEEVRVVEVDVQEPTPAITSALVPGGRS